MSHWLWLGVFGVVTWLGSGQSLAAQLGTAEGPHVSLVCESPAALKSWQRFVEECQNEIDRMLGYEARSERVVHIYFGTGEPGVQDPFHLAFRPDESMLQVTRVVTQALLLRECADPNGGAPPILPSLPWLSAAVTNRVLYGCRDPQGRAQPDYEPARFLFARDTFPDVLRLLTTPVGSEFPVPYHLYALHCDLLALCIQETAPANTLWQVLQMEQAGRTTSEALGFLLRDACQPGENLQGWYERTVVRVSRRGRRLSDGETVAQRLETLISVPVVAPGQNDFRGRRIPIEEVTETLDTLAVDKSGLARLNADLYELYKDAPELLREPIEAFMDACNSLSKGKKRAARKRFAQAREMFSTAVSRQDKLDAYLDDIERQYVPADVRLGLYLGIAQARLLDERSLDVSLQQYLDSLSQ